MAYWLLEWMEYSLLSSNGNVDVVYADNEKLSRVYPTYAPAVTRMAAIELLRNDQENAELHAKKAIALNPKDFTAISILAEILFDSNRHQEALQLHRSIIEMVGPTTCDSSIFANSLMECADYFLSIGFADTAKSCYQKVLQERPDTPVSNVTFSDYSKNTVQAHAAITLNALEKPEIFSAYEKASVNKPLPPPYLNYYVVGGLNPGNFMNAGRLLVHHFQEVLTSNHIELDSFQRILDFGCGVGRLSRQWSDFKGEVHGCDYNPYLIRWCRKFFGKNYHTNPLVGRLCFADEYFDFVYLLSVFTHLSPDIQDFWYHELLRIIKPGGYLLITVHGDQFRDTIPEKTRAHYDNGILVMVQTPFEGQNCCGAYHPKKYAYSTWDGEKTQIVCHVPGLTYPDLKQDMYLLRKRQIGA
ncbi:MAG: methyltransferase domain-containing protein [Chitinispirillaceae bacterium]|nr:methyltransferase domain-containing protein [Chitinispirillaceae bacterium]